MGYALVDQNIKIYYETWGEKNESPSVILLGAAVTDLTYWQYQINFLQKYYHVVALDYRGTGKSDTPKSFYSEDIIVADVKAVLDQEKITSIYLIGYSMGGLIAQKFTDQYPNKVDKLVLLNCTLGGGNPDTVLPKQEVVNMFLFFSALTSKDIIRNWMDYSFGDSFSKQDPELYQQYFDRCMQNIGTARHQVGIMLSNTPLVTDYKKLSMPVLAIYAEDDPLIPLSNDEVLKKYIPHAKIEYVSGYHGSIWIHPDRINNLLHMFLQN